MEDDSGDWTIKKDGASAGVVLERIVRAAKTVLTARWQGCIMKLVRYRENARILIKPVTDKNLFVHCAGGMKAVTTREYNKNVEQMLLIHGVGFLTIADETK